MTTTRTAIVTGAAKGIGAALALRLAADGHQIAAIDLSAESCGDTVARIAARGGTARAYGADVTQESRVGDLVESIAHELGSPTILINNAGILRDNLLFKMTTDDWDSVMNVHLRGHFLMSRAVQKFMVKDGFGRIVNLSSTSALGNRGQANYAAAKAGIQGFTKTLAIELGKFGITVNAIAPGLIETDMTRATAERMGVSYESFVEQAASQIPVARTGKPEDIASAASFFVREEAGFVSGQVLYVSGGPRA